MPRKAKPPTARTVEALQCPAGWDEEWGRRVLEYHETQTEEEAVAEDEAAYEAITPTAMEVPVDLVPVVRELIVKQRAGQGAPVDEAMRGFRVAR